MDRWSSIWVTLQERAVRRMVISKCNTHRQTTQKLSSSSYQHGSRHACDGYARQWRAASEATLFWGYNSRRSPSHRLWSAGRVDVGNRKRYVACAGRKDKVRLLRRKKCLCWFAGAGPRALTGTPSSRPQFFLIPILVTIIYRLWL